MSSVICSVILVSIQLCYLRTPNIARAGSDGNQVTVTVTCTDSGGNNYPLANTKGFSVNWTGSNGIFGSGSGTVTVTIPAGGYTSTAGIGKYYNSYDATFASSGTNKLYFEDGTSGGFIFNGDVIPKANESYALGDGNHYWKNIYCKKSAVDLSDANEKHDVQAIDEKYDTMFDALVPVSYIFNNSTNGRTHLGLTAQNLKEAILNAGMTTKDCAAYVEWVKDNGDTGCGIRYGELISLSINEIQKLKKRIAMLESLENF